MINLLPNNVQNGVQTQARDGRIVRQNNGADFDRLISQTQRNNSDAQAQNQRTNRADGVQDVRNGRQQHNVVNPANAAPQNEVANEPVEQTVQETTQTNVSAEAVAGEIAIPQDMQDELLAEIAAILGITVVVLQEILQDLEISIQDLFVAENRIEVLIAAKGLENQAQLLNYDEALPLVQEMTETVAKFALDVNVEHDVDVLPEFTQNLAEFDGEVVLQSAAQTVSTSSTQVPTAEITPEAVQPIESQAVSQQNNVVPEMTQTVVNTAVDVPQTVNVTPNVTTTMASTQTVVTPQSIAQQIVQNVRFVTGEQMAEIRIQLRPEHLGDVTMRIATVNGIVTAQFIAESQRVKELIEAGFTHLRDALEQAGVNIADIEVNVQSGDNPHFSFNDDEGSAVSARRINDLMNAAMAEEAEETAANQPMEENVVDYKV